LTPGPGSGKKSRSRIRDENLVSVFRLKILNFFDADPDSGFGIRDLVNPGSGILDLGWINIPDPQHCLLFTGKKIWKTKSRFKMFLKSLPFCVRLSSTIEAYRHVSFARTIQKGAVAKSYMIKGLLIYSYD
jgi:hypothetical protein